MNVSFGLKAFNATLGVIAAVLFVFFLYKIQFLLLVLFVSFIFASAIDPAVEFLSKRMSRKKALLLIGLIGFIVVSSILLPFLNIFLKQAILFFKQLPDYWVKIGSFLTGISNNVDKIGFYEVLTKVGLGKWTNLIESTGIFSDASRVMSTISGLSQQIMAALVSLTKNFGQGIIFVFFTLIISIFMLIDKTYLKNKLLDFFPANKREKAEKIGKTISKKVGEYLFAQVLLILIMSTLITLGLSLLKIEFSFILGFIAGFMEIIPVIGPIIATIIIVLVAVAQKPILGLWALAIYIVSEWILDNFIRPFVIGKFLKIHPLNLIFSVTVGSLLFGAPGMILAPAISATICVLIDEFYIIPLKEKPVGTRKSRVPRR